MIIYEQMSKKKPFSFKINRIFQKSINIWSLCIEILWSLLTFTFYSYSIFHIHYILFAIAIYRLCIFTSNSYETWIISSKNRHCIYIYTNWNVVSNSILFTQKITQIDIWENNREYKAVQSEESSWAKEIGTWLQPFCVLSRKPTYFLPLRSYTWYDCWLDSFKLKTCRMYCNCVLASFVRNSLAFDFFSTISNPHILWLVRF